MKYIILLLMLSVQAQAAATCNLYYGYAVGGEDLHTSQGQVEKLNSGGGFLLGIAWLLPFTEPNPHGFEAQVSASLMDSMEVGELDWIRFPVEVMSFYRNGRENFRAGYGASLHLGNRLAGGVNKRQFTTDFEPALGWTIAAEKIFHDNGAIGLKYTRIDYKPVGEILPTRGDQLLVYLAVSGLDSKL